MKNTSKKYNKKADADCTRTNTRRTPGKYCVNLFA